MEGAGAGTGMLLNAGPGAPAGASAFDEDLETLLPLETDASGTGRETPSARDAAARAASQQRDRQACLSVTWHQCKHLPQAFKQDVTFTVHLARRVVSFLGYC